MPTMYDAILPSSIPNVPPPDYCMGYVNGEWPSFVGMKARFPTAIPVSIAAVPAGNQYDAQGCDGESGDFDPAEAAHFAAVKIAANVVPFIYCSYSAWPDYRSAVANPLMVDWLIAAYPGIGPIPYPNSIGHQWIDRGSYDESVIVPNWQPGRPINPVQKEEEMPFYMTNSTGTGFVVALDLSSKRGIPDANDAQVLLNTGMYHIIPQGQIDDALINAIPNG